MLPEWKTQTVSLPYWIGEVCLFRKSFELQVTDVDFLHYNAEDTSLLNPYNSVVQGDENGYMRPQHN